MEENTQAPSLMAHAVRSGVIIGALAIVITMILYIINPSVLVSLWMFLVLVLDLILLVIFGIQYRNQIGGYMNFGAAWKHGFVALFVAGILSVLFNMLLYFVIDPDLPQVLTDASVDNALSIAQSFGASGEALEQAAEDARERSEGQFTVGGMLSGFGMAIIFYAIIALITGAIVKKRNPEEEI